MNTADITGIILAGGRGARLQGADKGLLPLAGKPLIAHSIERLRPQVSNILINANRNQTAYATYGAPVYGDPDVIPGEHFLGPLAGILGGMLHANGAYVLTVPCDVPFFPAALAQRLCAQLSASHASLCIAHDGTRSQHLFMLAATHMQEDLRRYLLRGERKVELWLREVTCAVADFSDQPGAFFNINTPEDLQTHP